MPKAKMARQPPSRPGNLAISTRNFDFPHLVSESCKQTFIDTNIPLNIEQDAYRINER